MIKSIFYGTVKNGHFVPELSKQLRVTMEHLEGQPVQMTISKKRKPRSDNQNKYYWSVIVDILGNELGLNQDETHDFIKWKFLKIGRRKTIGDQVVWHIEYPRSTTTLSTVEFEDLMAKIRQWAATDLKITIPLPNEVDLDQL